MEFLYFLSLMFGGKGSAFQASEVVYRCTSGTLHRAWHRRYESVYKTNKLLGSFFKHVYFVTQMLKCNRLLIYLLANLHTSTVNIMMFPEGFTSFKNIWPRLSLKNRHCSVSSLLTVSHPPGIVRLRSKVSLILAMV